MSNNQQTARATRPSNTVWSETKSALKSTEFYVWLVVSIAILVAAAVIDGDDDNQRFGADNAWLYVAIVTAAYIVSRGLAKAGVHRDDRQDNDRS
jgi:hypothetical protein